MKLNREQLKDMIREIRSEMIVEKAECPGQPGNPWHADGSADNPGGFTDPDKEAGSWSRRNGKGACKRQYSRDTKGTKKSKTAEPCGRKSKHKCHKGELKEDGLLAAPEQGKDKYRTKRREILFPGSKAAQSLARGIYESMKPVLAELTALNEGEEQTKCFSAEELKKYKQRIVQSLWVGISNYTKATKGEI